MSESGITKSDIRMNESESTENIGRTKVSIFRERRTKKRFETRKNKRSEARKRGRSKKEFT